MNTDDFVNLVRCSAVLTRRQVQSSKWYMFGSALSEEKLINDYDVLVVYQNDEDRKIIRESLDLLLSSLPVHLFMMTEEEEHQCKFIALQHVRHIFG